MVAWACCLFGLSYKDWSNKVHINWAVVYNCHKFVLIHPADLFLLCVQGCHTFLVQVSWKLKPYDLWISQVFLFILHTMIIRYAVCLRFTLYYSSLKVFKHYTVKSSLLKFIYIFLELVALPQVLSSELSFLSCQRAPGGLCRILNCSCLQFWSLGFCMS